MSKKLEGFKWMYENCNQGTLYDAYQNPSSAKRYAWEAIANECHNRNGYGLKVTGHNCMKFSCAYAFVDPEDGVEKIVYHTAENVYIIER